MERQLKAFVWLLYFLDHYEDTSLIPHSSRVPGVNKCRDWSPTAQMDLDSREKQVINAFIYGEHTLINVGRLVPLSGDCGSCTKAVHQIRHSQITALIKTLDKDGQEHHRHQKFHPGTTVTVALFSPNAQVPRWGQVDPEERHKQNLSPKSELDLAHSMFLYFEFLLQGLRINMELFMKFFRWQHSLRTEGIEGTGGCINNSITLCQRTSFANSSAPFSISSSAVSASKHSFTRAQIVLDSHLSSRSPYGPPTAPRHDPDQQE
ncbi:hypothetical protein STEG23_036376 [Scotinomys teguina]